MLCNMFYVAKTHDIVGNSSNNIIFSLLHKLKGNNIKLIFDQYLYNTLKSS
jgi:hypothetical protein